MRPSDKENHPQYLPLTPAIFYILLALVDGEKHGYAIMRDVELAVRQRGRLSVIVLYLRLIVDGLINAAAEHVQTIRMAHKKFEPAPWSVVFLTAIPGLWIALTLRHADVLGPALTVVGAGYLVFLVTAVPITWQRLRRVPVWTLLPLGMLVWMLILRLGVSLSSLAAPGLMGVIITLFNGILAAVIFSIMLNGRRLPKTALFLIGVMMLSGVVTAIHNNQLARWNGGRPLELLVGAFYGPLEALMLVAAGLLFARHNNVLALLVVLGGYGAMFLDSDYLWGSPARDWPYLSLYLVGMILIFFVLAPVGLLRARARLGQAIALFLPAIIFLAARLAVPALVLGPAARTYFGDLLISANILLALSLGWILYASLGDSEYKNRPAKQHLST